MNELTDKQNDLWDAHFDASSELALAAMHFANHHLEGLVEDADHCPSTAELLVACAAFHDTYEAAENEDMREQIKDDVAAMSGENL